MKFDCQVWKSVANLTLESTTVRIELHDEKLIIVQCKEALFMPNKFHDIASEVYCLSQNQRLNEFLLTLIFMAKGISWRLAWSFSKRFYGS
jgi:hypothetical protein